MITFILGGNKSGKSDFALDLLAEKEGQTTFIATGKARDLEFRKQINQHRIERAASMSVYEVDEDLPRALIQARGEEKSVLVDSLDYWIFAIREAGTEEEKVEELLSLLASWDGPDVVLVSCEIGLGPLPAGSAVRRFVRSLGALNKRVAQVADEVYLVAAGLPITLKKS